MKQNAKNETQKNTSYSIQRLNIQYLYILSNNNVANSLQKYYNCFKLYCNENHLICNWINDHSHDRLCKRCDIHQRTFLAQTQQDTFLVAYG